MREVVRGHNCMAPVKIGGMEYRVCLDTGGARSLINKEFLLALARGRNTRDAVKQRYQWNKTITREGVGGEATRPMDGSVEVQLEFVGTPDDASMGRLVKVLVEFGELPNAADDLLIGYPPVTAMGLLLLPRRRWQQLGGLEEARPHTSGRNCREVLVCRQRRPRS